MEPGKSIRNAFSISLAAAVCCFAANPCNGFSGETNASKTILVPSASENPEAVSGAYPGADQPAFSPDGRRLACVIAKEGLKNIWVMNSDFTGKKQVTFDGGELPSWSPDGEKIVFVRKINRKAGLAVVNVRNASVTNLVSDRICDNPAWGRNNLIAYDALQDFDWCVNTVDVKGENNRTIKRNASQPAWSPDCSLIAYVAKSENSQVNEVWVMNAEGGDARQVSSGSMQGGVLHPDFSPDGRRVIYADFSMQPFANICVINLDGTGKHTVVDMKNDTQCYHAKFSPDGAYIIHVSGKGGVKGIRKLPLAGLLKEK